MARHNSKGSATRLVRPTLPLFIVLAARALVLALLTSFLVIVLAGIARAEGVVSLEAGVPTPHAGVLLTEVQLDRMTERLIAGEECRGTLEASETVRRSLTDDLADAESRASRQVPQPAVQHSEWPWVALGFVAGAAAAGLAVWGAVEVMRAVRL